MTTADDVRRIHREQKAWTAIKRELAEIWAFRKSGSVLAILVAAYLIGLYIAAGGR